MRGERAGPSCTIESQAFGRESMIQVARRILVVDDHIDSLNAMARLLLLTGFEVSTATTYAAAIEQCKAMPFDLLISDVGLPDGNGYDLMREMLGRRSAMRGIAVSGYAAEADVEQSLAAGFSAHLIKPVQFDALRAAIARLIPT
jgi:CheY-like chemotaxis protein